MLEEARKSERERERDVTTEAEVSDGISESEDGKAPKAKMQVAIKRWKTQKTEILPLSFQKKCSPDDPTNQSCGPHWESNATQGTRCLEYAGNYNERS